MPRAKPDLKDKICEAALRLAGQGGWSALTFDRIAKAAKIPLAKVRENFSDTADLMPAIVGWVDGRQAENIGFIDTRDAPRDRLFQVMMARFDILQKHRKAILSILCEGGARPGNAVRILPAHLQSMKRVVKLARLDTKKIPEPLMVAGLLSIYYRTLCSWQKDTSSDMARTMANLDRALQLGEKGTEILFRMSKRARCL